ncbi:hypothetical protein [Massilia sp. Mn16-1_5]|uniref:hypothetical protein n=1 Tax=Massilia sp. Mn16-1_5 TaxID=2079199 RepID=UPI001E55F67C|nr:hypothetical protein [Massilia sp. Mn16-1_5]
MHEKRAAKIYMRELIASIALYTIILMAAIRFGRPMEPGVLRTVVLLTPMIGFAAALWAIVRQIQRADEYIRMRLLENVALGAAITAGLTFTYGFLETAGYPKLSMFTVWCVLCLSVAAVQLIRKVLDR